MDCMDSMDENPGPANNSTMKKEGKEKKVVEWVNEWLWKKI
jgi:hypothetical protein